MISYMGANSVLMFSKGERNCKEIIPPDKDNFLQCAVGSTSHW